MAPIIGLGSDLIEIARIQKACERYGDLFLSRIFHPLELKYCLTKKNPYPSLAARFAAKEAVAKAFQVGIGAHLKWTSVAVLSGEQGQPIILLDELGNQLLERVKGTQVLVSLTHTLTLAQAVSIIVS
jgi:holo-[acyl-carrier protein] synthase